MTSQKKIVRHTVLALALSVLPGLALADKPDRSGGGKHKGKEEREHGRADRDDDRHRGDDRQGGSISFSFGSDDRRIVSEYYGIEARQGTCPPGLAKKNNGCQPPGQAKKWRKGQPLGKDIAYYDIPRDLRMRLPAPPPNHRYVQVAGDILLIAVGSSMVVDAIEDILR